MINNNCLVLFYKPRYKESYYRVLFAYTAAKYLEFLCILFLTQFYLLPDLLSYAYFNCKNMHYRLKWLTCVVCLEQVMPAALDLVSCFSWYCAKNGFRLIKMQFFG